MFPRHDTLICFVGSFDRSSVSEGVCPLGKFNSSQHEPFCAMKVKKNNNKGVNNTGR